MCNTLNIKALELYCNIKKWNIELDTLVYILGGKCRYYFFFDAFSAFFFSSSNVNV